MEKQFKKKITLKMNNVSSSRFVKTYSGQFVVGGCKWRLSARLSSLFGGHLTLCLEVVDYGSLPSGWRRRARYFLYLLKQNSVESLKQYEKEQWFDENSYFSSSTSLFPIRGCGILAKDGGFFINNGLKIVAEVEVLEVVGKSDVTEETSVLMETMDVNCFHVPSSQVDSVSHMFERDPEMASDFRSKNPNLRTGFMSLLLSLIETLRHSPHKLHKDDLAVAYAALGSMTESGFKLDWLEKKLDEMSGKIKKEETGETRMLEIENELKDLKLKCSDLEAELEKEKLEVLAAKEPISLDDVI